MEFSVAKFLSDISAKLREAAFRLIIHLRRYSQEPTSTATLKICEDGNGTVTQTSPPARHESNEHLNGQFFSLLKSFTLKTDGKRQFSKLLVQICWLCIYI